MSSKVWRVVGEYRKKGRTFIFRKEVLAPKETHAREKVYSDLGSRHRVKRRDIRFTEVVEIRPEEVTSIELRRALGVESEG